MHVCCSICKEGSQGPGPKVPRLSAVWFKNNVPRWALTVWLCCLGRLATKDRCISWWMEVESQNSSQATNTVNPLSLIFLNSTIWCYLASVIIDAVLKLAMVVASYYTNQKQQLAMAATVDHQWLERNARIFTSKSVDCSSLQCMIDKAIRDRICSWSVKNTHTLPSLQSLSFSKNSEMSWDGCWYFPISILLPLLL